MLTAIRRLGVGRVTCVGEGPNWAAPLVDDWVVVDPMRPVGDLPDKVRRHSGRPDAVLALDDSSVMMAAELAAAFRLPGVGPGSAARATARKSFREACRAEGVPTPRYTYVNIDKHNVAAALRTGGISFPVVVKPAHGVGGVFVRRVDGLQELEAVLADFQARFVMDPRTARRTHGTMLVEEYVEGPEVTIDLLVQSGQLHYAAVADRFAPVEPYFLERGRRIPSALPGGTQKELVRMAAAVLEALDLDDCCAQVDARWTAQGAEPIDVKLTVGATAAHRFNLDAFGVDLVQGAMQIAFGVPLDVTPPSAASCHLRSAAFRPPVGGVLRSIRVDPGVQDDPSLAELVVCRELGETVRVPPEASDYLGWIAVRGRTRAEADEKLLQLVNGIRFKIGSQSFHGAFTGLAGF